MRVQRPPSGEIGSAVARVARPGTALRRPGTRARSCRPATGTYGRCAAGGNGLSGVDTSGSPSRGGRRTPPVALARPLDSQYGSYAYGPAPSNALSAAHEPGLYNGYLYNDAPIAPASRAARATALCSDWFMRSVSPPITCTGLPVARRTK